MKVHELDFHLIWIALLVLSVFSVILSVFICICWKGRKRQNKSYIMNSESISTTSFSGKQKYYLHDVQYSSIDQSADLSTSIVDPKRNEHFSYNILSIFRNIQNNKFTNLPEDMNKILPNTLEDSATENMHRNFDKSVLCLQWNEAEKGPNEKDETYSCISSDSKTTFTSVVPFYNRSGSIAETFMSTNSEH